tara:strand:+ start:569 stop:715 length:147 start_codon:yes stop_codon:yes gene_type:complete
MKARKLVFAMVTMMALGTFTACTNESTTSEDELYEQSIDGNEIKDEDM